MTSIIGKISDHAARMRSGYLSLAGLGVLTYGLWEHWHPLAGCVSAGVSLLLIDWARDKQIIAETGARR